jgi:hypothetical protein
MRLTVIKWHPAAPHTPTVARVTVTARARSVPALAGGGQWVDVAVGGQGGDVLERGGIPSFGGEGLAEALLALVVPVRGCGSGGLG